MGRLNSSVPLNVKLSANMCEQSYIGRLRMFVQQFATVAVPVALLAIAFLFTGCVHIQKPVEPSATLSTNTAIVYGRFYGFAPGDGRLSFDIVNAIALQLRNLESQRSYLVGFRLTNSTYFVPPLYYPPTNLINSSRTKSVFGIAVPPGRYTIDGYLTILDGHVKLDQVSFPTTPAFDCRPNSATYIGDFTSGEHTLPSGARELGVFGVTNNFAETTAQFQANYQKLTPAAFTCATEALKTFETHPKIYDQKIHFAPPDDSFNYVDIFPVTSCHN